MGTKVLWAYRPSYGYSPVYLLDEKPVKEIGKHTGHVEYVKWRELGGPVIKTGKGVSVRITIEEVHSDGK